MYRVVLIRSRWMLSVCVCSHRWINSIFSHTSWMGVQVWNHMLVGNLSAHTIDHTVSSYVPVNVQNSTMQYLNGKIGHVSWIQRQFAYMEQMKRPRKNQKRCMNQVHEMSTANYLGRMKERSETKIVPQWSTIMIYVALHTDKYVFTGIVKPVTGFFLYCIIFMHLRLTESSVNSTDLLNVCRLQSLINKTAKQTRKIEEFWLQSKIHKKKYNRYSCVLGSVSAGKWYIGIIDETFHSQPATIFHRKS